MNHFVHIWRTSVFNYSLFLFEGDIRVSLSIFQPFLILEPLLMFIKHLPVIC